MKSSSPPRRKNIGLIILSAIDVITGILSLIITAFAVQVIAIMASGLTLIKAIKVAVQSEKTAAFVKPVAVYAVRTLTRSEKMKRFFCKVKEDLKNNPVTLITAIIELVFCGGLGYVLLDFLEQFAWAVGWKLYAVSFGGAFVVYSVLAVLTVFLGHDSAAFATIRKFVKSIGGEKAVEVLDKANAEVVDAILAERRRKEEEAAANAARAEEEARIAAEREANALEEQRIYEYALQREAEARARAEAEERRRLITKYRGEYASTGAEGAQGETVVEVVNNANSHNIQG